MEVDDVNKKELAKQMIEEALKGNHVKLEIIVGGKLNRSYMPFCKQRQYI